MSKFTPQFNISVDIVTFSIFETNRKRLNLSNTAYLNNLLALDYSGDVVLEKPIKYKRRVDLNQIRLYSKKSLESDSNMED